jgi:preprotein translocase subunit SecG
MVLIVLLTCLHVAVAVILILVVLLQTGKRADLAGAFGGGGSQTAFGARGAATVLSRLTTWAAILFMATSLALSILSSRESGGGGSVLEDLPAASAPATPPPSAPAPAAPAAPAPTPQAPAPSN